jgi:uncharacterized membrane protein YeaQ/YmgE (transglycosylase-associated protein family)
MKKIILAILLATTAGLFVPHVSRANENMEIVNSIMGAIAGGLIYTTLRSKDPQLGYKRKAAEFTGSVLAGALVGGVATNPQRAADTVSAVAQSKGVQNMFGSPQGAFFLLLGWTLVYDLYIAKKTNQQ